MKHLLTLALLVCLGTFASAQIPFYVPTNGLVGWWPFNGNANDESGNGNNGTIVGGVTNTTDRFGAANSAYLFNGIDGYVDVPSLNSLTYTPITYSAWVIINSYFPSSFGHKFRSIIGRNTTFIAENGVIGFYADNNAAGGAYDNSFTMWRGGGVSGQPPYSASIPPLNTWLHVVYTQNSNGDWKWYQNGILTNSNNFNDVQNDFNFFRIGGCNNGGGYLWNDKLDDIAIYNRALSPAEVQQLYIGNCKQPTFTAQPQNTSVGQGQTTTFAVQVDTTSTFQWQMNLGLGAGWVNIPQSSLFSGDTTATLSVQGRNPLDGAQFRCIATACQSDTSNAATLTVTSNSSTLGSVAGVPGKINYQGAAMDSLGKPMKNQTIALQLSVLDSSSSGAAAYVETHSTPTNGSGLFSLQIGGGTAVTGTFDSIPWANGRNKYLKTEVQQNGTWINLGTSQLVSVPYALVSGVAKRAEELIDSMGNTFLIGYENGQATPTLIPSPNRNPFSCGNTIFYGGENYQTVLFGNQCWFSKNLNIGKMINGSDRQIDNNLIEKYCYDNVFRSCDTFGGFYQWAEAVQYKNGASDTSSPNPAFTGNVQGICPVGWHIPKMTEWFIFFNFIDSSFNPSKTGAIVPISNMYKLISDKKLWNYPNNVNSNIYSNGYSCFPGGFCYGGLYFNKYASSYFWGIDENNTYHPNRNRCDLQVSIDENGVQVAIDMKFMGFSVRCLKD